MNISRITECVLENEKKRNSEQLKDTIGKSK